MLLGIDHLVIAVRDPDAAAATLEHDLGLAFTGGGRHENTGTYNRLAFLGDTYLELIGVFDADLVRSSASFAVGLAALTLLEGGREGLATWAIATDDMTGDVARLRSAGSPIGEPVAGSRIRPDGETVRWITAFPSLGPEDPPFLIEHELRGAEWGEAARAARQAFRHPSGGRARVTGLSIPVHDPAAVRARYADAIGLRFDEAGRAVVGGQRIEARVGGPAALPVVQLAAEPGWGSPRFDVARFGIRWQRDTDDSTAAAG